MNRLTIALAAVGICLLLAAPAVSEESSEENQFARSGPYLAVGVVGANLTRIDELGSGVDEEPAAGFTVLGGYRINPGVAFELQFEMLPSVVTGLGKRGELSMITVTGNMKTFILTGRFQPYALIGLGGMRREFDEKIGQSLDGRESSFAFRFGVGLDFYITEKIFTSLGADYLLPTGDSLEDFDYVSYGGRIGYRF